MDMEQVQLVCRIGQEAECCRYLVMGTKGFECMKTNPLNKAVIDEAWDDSKSAQGDNCKGYKHLRFV